MENFCPVKSRNEEIGEKDVEESEGDDPEKWKKYKL